MVSALEETGFPRSRGDEPHLLHFLFYEAEFSPLTRG